MEISKEALLSKTHYGLNIYAHVLQKYYPVQSVLSLSGRDCQPVKNLFNNHKPTLKIAIVNNCAMHHDLEDPSNKGDAFSFAAMHYRLEGEALYHKLNEAMHLQMTEPLDFYNRQQATIQPSLPAENTPPGFVSSRTHSQPASPIADKAPLFSYFKNPVTPPGFVSPRTGLQPASPVADKVPLFSYFKNPVTNIFPAKQANLLEVYHLIKSDSFITVTHTLRNTEDAKRAKEYKAAHFDYVTFSGTFSKRTDKALLQHSGLLTIDFDHLEHPQSLKEQLLEDEYFETELLFISPSGDGLKWIIPIDLSKATHQDYFKSISNYILHRYQVKIDPSGKDISRACFLPHDAGVYINPKYSV